MQFILCRKGPPIYIQHAAEFCDSRYFTRENFEGASKDNEEENGEDATFSASPAPRIRPRATSRSDSTPPGPEELQAHASRDF
jgi:hypothetical protein